MPRITDRFFDLLRGSSEKSNGASHRLWDDGIFESAGIGMWLFNACGETVYVNRLVASRLGYSREEMLVLPVITFIGEEAVELIQRHAHNCKQGTPESHEAKLIHRGGVCSCD